MAGGRWSVGYPPKIERIKQAKSKLNTFVIRCIVLYNYSMKNDYTTTRSWSKTLRNLRMIHALTGDSIVSILHRLSEKELKRVQAQYDAQEEKRKS